MDEFEEMIRKKFLEEGEITAEEARIDALELTEEERKALEAAQKMMRMTIAQEKLSKNDEL